MLAVYRAVVSWPIYASPDQHASNTLAFRGQSAGTTVTQDLDSIQARLQAAYNIWDGLLPGAIFGTSAVGTVLYYNLGDPTPRVPIEERDITMAPGGTTPYPSDVAVVCSFRGAYESGEIRARRRGRIYLGPVLASMGAAVTGQGIRITPAAETIMTNGMLELLSVDSTTPVWCVYSEANAAAYEVVEVSTNNQFDTRRSRDRGDPVVTRLPVVQI